MKQSTKFLIITLFLFGCLIATHEGRHLDINDTFNVESRLVFFKGGFPVAVERFGEGCTVECKMLHETNEIVGYYLMIVFWIIISGFYSLLLIIEENNKIESIK